MFNLLNLFRRRIVVGNESYLCRLRPLPKILRSFDDGSTKWVQADSQHLSAYESKYMKGDYAPWTPIVALGSGTNGEGFFLDVPFIGINDYFPGRRHRGRATVSKSPGCILNRDCNALEVKRF